MFYFYTKIPGTISIGGIIGKSVESRLQKGNAILVNLELEDEEQGHIMLRISKFCRPEAVWKVLSIKLWVYFA